MGKLKLALVAWGMLLLAGVTLAVLLPDPEIVEVVVVKEVIVEVPAPPEAHTCITMDWMVRVQTEFDQGFFKSAEQVWCVHFKSKRIGPTIEGLEDDREIILKKELFPKD